MHPFAVDIPWIYPTRESHWHSANALTRSIDTCTPRQDLLVEVVEELAPPVLVYEAARTVMGIDEVPVPMVQVDANVLPEVRNPVLLFQVGSGVVHGDLERLLQLYFQFVEKGKNYKTYDSIV